MSVPRAKSGKAYFAQRINLWSAALTVAFVLLVNANRSIANEQKIGHQVLIGPATVYAAKMIVVHETNVSVPRVITLKDNDSRFKAVRIWALKHVIDGLNKAVSNKLLPPGRFRIQFYDREHPNLSSLLLEVPLGKETLGLDWEKHLSELKELLQQ